MTHPFLDGMFCGAALVIGLSLALLIYFAKAGK